MYLYRTAASQETEPDKTEKRKGQDAFICSSLCFQLKLKTYDKDNNLLLLHKVDVALYKSCHDSWTSSQLAFCPAPSISLKNAFTLPISCCQVTVQSRKRTKANSIAGKIQEKKDWPWTRFHLMLLGALALARTVSKACILLLFLQEITC